MCSDPPLSIEDIPSGLWLCHTCRMTQQLHKSSTKSRVNSIEQDLAQIEQRSRPCTPDSSDVMLSAAKLRLMHKRSTSRVSSCSDRSTNTEREVKQLPRVSTPPLPPPPPPPSQPLEAAQNSCAENGINGEPETSVNGIATTVTIDDAIDEIKTEDEHGAESSECNEDRSAINLRTSLDQLVYAASIMNPKQFELPREMNIFPKFPGDDKGNENFDSFP